MNIKLLKEKNIYYLPQLYSKEDIIFAYLCEQKGIHTIKYYKYRAHDSRFKDSGAKSSHLPSNASRKEDAMERVELTDGEKAYFLMEGTLVDIRLQDYLRREYDRMELAHSGDKYATIKKLLQNEAAFRSRPKKEVAVLEINAISADVTCYLCHELGHWKRDCPQLKGRNVGDRSQNRRQRSPERRRRSLSPPRRRPELPRDNFAKRRREESKKEEWEKEKLKRIRCNNCRGFGHKFFKCPSPKINHGDADMVDRRHR